MSKMTRKSTPDIMAGLMGGAATIPSPIESEIAETEKQESNKAVIHATQDQGYKEEAINTANIKTINKAAPESLKEKTTFNLSQHTLTALEDTWMKLRRKLKGEQRITKTLIVEKAIEIAIADLEARSELSELYKKLKS